MSASGFTLRLEYVAQRSGCEPVELVQEFPIDHYKVDDPANTQGEAIVGVEIIPHAANTPPTYHFYRVEAQTTPLIDDPLFRARCVAIKLRWDDPAHLQISTSAFYIARRETVDATVPADPANGRWLLVLKQVNGTNHLVYQLDSAANTSNPCADLAAIGIHCATTTVNCQKMTCRARGCPA